MRKRKKKIAEETIDDVFIDYSAKPTDQDELNLDRAQAMARALTDYDIETFAIAKYTVFTDPKEFADTKKKKGENNPGNCGRG